MKDYILFSSVEIILPTTRITPRWPPLGVRALTTGGYIIKKSEVSCITAIKRLVLWNALPSTKVEEIWFLHGGLAPILRCPELLHRFAGSKVQPQIGRQIEARPGCSRPTGGDLIAGVGAAHDVEAADVIARDSVISIAVRRGGEEILLLAAIFEPEVNVIARTVIDGQNRRPRAYG